MRQEISWAKTLTEAEGFPKLTIKISLPNLKAELIPGTCSPSLVLVAGGRTPDSHWLEQLCQKNTTWAVDRGVDTCISAGVIPSFFIGDRDSASREGILWARDNHIHSAVFPTEKDQTDLQIALKMAGESGFHSEVILTGTFGGRSDHFFANIFSMIWAEEEWGIRARCAADEREAVFLLKGPESIEFTNVSPGTFISTLSLSEKCTGVSLWGTKWSIPDGALYIRHPFAVSNVVTGIRPTSSEKVSFGAKISSGWMGIFITAPDTEKRAGSRQPF